MKKVVIFIFYIIFVQYSCNTTSSDNTDTSDTTVSSGNLDTSKIQHDYQKPVPVNGVYDKIVARLNNLKEPKSRRDSAIAQMLSEFNFQNQTTAPIQLSSNKCPFDPYMFVIYDHKLDLLNIKLDSIYTLDLTDKIQTASWSPFNKSEIFILTIDEKKKPISEYAQNLKLFCLNLNSMQFRYLTTFF